MSNIRQLLWMLADASGKPMSSEDEDGPLRLWAGLLPALHELQALAERSIVQHLWTRHVLPGAKFGDYRGGALGRMAARGLVYLYSSAS